ncbi:Maf family protein [Paludibacterium yongneupense]|uniref:Maf family protein n=1 Tax=Paludibacterium yongneupense TaxID=400061 RepID=UPI0004168C26|nr:Maf family protein [Paludibacterium yongneupense]
MTTTLYLASASPRRRELLAQLCPHFERIHAEIDETPRPGEEAVAYAERMAREKAVEGWRTVVESGLPVRPLLAADTTVVLDGVIYGKPVDAADARRMLLAFSGNTHQVVTALAVREGERMLQRTSITDVSFRALSADEIDRYLDSGEAFDKAGAYGIQGKACVFIERIAGSYTGVMGLPLFETAALLAEFGFSFP